MITTGIILLIITLFAFISAILMNALYVGNVMQGIIVFFAIGLSCLLYGIYKRKNKPNEQNDDNDEIKK